ncbi:uncharacterized protein LOC141621792 [Silene latifolia]|uniref:uncharacterized protein LOC141621792 n=1 Tax=Silene latifolia TaxID=37657 RepID=UPI003D77E47F
MAVFRSRAWIYITFSSLSSNHFLVHIFGSGPAVFVPPIRCPKLIKQLKSKMIQGFSSFLSLMWIGDRDKVVDFHWNLIDPWTLVNVSDDFSSSAGGGTLQIWRIIDFLWRPEE